MSEEHCYGRTESKSQGIVLALLLVACGIAGRLGDAAQARYPGRLNVFHDWRELRSSLVGARCTSFGRSVSRGRWVTHVILDRMTAAGSGGASRTWRQPITGRPLRVLARERMSRLRLRSGLSASILVGRGRPSAG
jgi:hypothetical protein